MILRTRHLVCMILLLSAMRAADGSILPIGDYGLDAHFINALLSDHTDTDRTDVEVARHHKGPGYISPFDGLPTRPSDTLQAEPSSLATFRTPWTMRPPAAHCAALQCATSHAG